MQFDDNKREHITIYLASFAEQPERKTLAIDSTDRAWARCAAILEHERDEVAIL